MANIAVILRSRYLGQDLSGFSLRNNEISFEDDSSELVFKKKNGSLVRFRTTDKPVLGRSLSTNVNGTQLLETHLFDYFDLTLEGNTNLVLQAAPLERDAVINDVITCTIILRQDFTGGRVFTFGGGDVTWVGSNPQEYTFKGTNDILILSLFTLNHGTTWVGKVNNTRIGSVGPGTNDPDRYSSTITSASGGVSIPIYEQDIWYIEAIEDTQITFTQTELVLPNKTREIQLVLKISPFLGENDKIKYSFTQNLIWSVSVYSGLRFPRNKTSDIMQVGVMFTPDGKIRSRLIATYEE